VKERQKNGGRRIGFLCPLSFVLIHQRQVCDISCPDPAAKAAATFFPSARRRQSWNLEFRELLSPPGLALTCPSRASSDTVELSGSRCLRSSSSGVWRGEGKAEEWGQENRILLSPFLCPISFVPFPLSHFLCPDSSKAVMRDFVPRSCG
jgi:hypothetical protein